MNFSTADLCDTHSDQDHFQIAEPIFKIYGDNHSFCGQISTVKVFEDNALIREILEEPVNNRVLVIDGGGSHRCALVDSELAQLACNKGWQGIIIYGCLRNTATINTLPVGIRALHTHPLKSNKKGHGDQNITVTFAGVQFKKNHFLYADEDGIIVSETELS